MFLKISGQILSSNATCSDEIDELRVIGVDGQVGPLLETALEHLGQAGWIPPEKRGQIPFIYETENEGWGWYRHHHHHLHVSMNP